MFTFFTKIQQPSVYLYGIRIDEPVTALTGLFIVCTCWYYCWKLRDTPIKDRSVRYVYLGLLALGLSTFLGAILGHAFLYKVGMAGKLPGWLIGNISGYFFAQAAMSRYYGGRRKAAQRNVRAANMAALLLCSGMAITALDFFWVMLYTAFSLIAVMLTLELKLYQAGDRTASPLFLKGIWIMTGSVVPIVLKFSISPWFNYLDIGHVLMCFTVSYFGRAMLAMNFKASPYSTPAQRARP